MEGARPGLTVPEAARAADRCNKALPSDIAARLEAAAIDAARDAGVVARLRELAAEPVGSTGAELAATIRDEDANWGPVARTAGVTAD